MGTPANHAILPARYAIPKLLALLANPISI